MTEVNGVDKGNSAGAVQDPPSDQGIGKGVKNGSDPLKSWYGHIRLDISNSVLPLEKLGVTPSYKDGLSEDVEIQIRNLSCELIQLAGKLLKLPQVAMATGCVLFQRFYYAKSIVRIPFDIVAMSCVGLASKIEEAPRRIRDIINVFTHIKQIRNGKQIQPVVLDQNYISLKNQVIKAERRVLKELGFCVHVKHPHKIIVMYLKWLQLDDNKELIQMSWNFMNDSLRTDVFVRYSPETIASACIYLSARKMKVPLPKNPTWFRVLNVEEDDIRDCCYRIVTLYNRTKPNQEELEAAVEGLRKKMDESRRAARDQMASATGTPSQSSPASRTGSPAGGSKVSNFENGKPRILPPATSENVLGFHERRLNVQDYDDHDDDHNRKKRKKHERSRSRSRSQDDYRSRSGRRDRKKTKHKSRRDSGSPGSPYSPKKGSKGRHRSRDRYYHRSEPGVRGGTFAASDNYYYDDNRDSRSHKSRKYYRR